MRCGGQNGGVKRSAVAVLDRKDRAWGCVKNWLLATAALLERRWASGDGSAVEAGGARGLRPGNGCGA